MNLDRINRAERAMLRLEARIASLLEDELRKELADAVWLVQECRQAAQAVQEDAKHIPEGERRDRFVIEARARLLAAITPET